MFFTLCATARKKINSSGSNPDVSGVQITSLTEGESVNEGQTVLLEVNLNTANNSVLVTKSKHIRGHVAAFSDTTDMYRELAEATEMIGLRANYGLYCFDDKTGQAQNNAYAMGGMDFGWYEKTTTLPTALRIGELTRKGRPVTAISYGGGGDSDASTKKPDLLGGRNSLYETTPLAIQYDEGLTDDDLISRANTFRWNYYNVMSAANNIAGTQAQGIANLESHVAATLSAGGWYTDFNHWHYFTEDNIVLYFQKINEFIGSADVFKGSYSDVLEYYWVREAVDSITYDNQIVTINYSKKYPNSPYHKITTPLWVKVDLSGSYLSGKSITTTHGGKIRSMGGDIYYISIPLDFTLTSVSFGIKTTDSPKYINLNKPVVTRNGNQFTSDQPIKVTIFSKAKGALEITTLIEERQLQYQTNPVIGFTLDTVNKDYYVAYINQEGISGVLEIN